MDKKTDVTLLKQNFKKVEEKFIDHFRQGVPRWPGETHDLLRNHYKNFEHSSMKMLTIERLCLEGLPEPILKEVSIAFEAFQRGEEYK